MIVLDASAVLALIQQEPGAEHVDAHIDGSSIGAANLCEVLGRFGNAAEMGVVASLLAARGVRVAPVTEADARAAALLRVRRPDLSLGDRLCLALTERLGAVALTADRAWGSTDHVRQIRPSTSNLDG